MLLYKPPGFGSGLDLELECNGRIYVLQRYIFFPWAADPWAAICTLDNERVWTEDSESDGSEDEDGQTVVEAPCAGVDQLADCFDALTIEKQQQIFVRLVEGESVCLRCSPTGS